MKLNKNIKISLLHHKMSTIKYENMKFQNLIEIILGIEQHSKLKATTIGTLDIKYTN